MNNNPIDSIKDFAKEKTSISIDNLESILKKYELENIHNDFSEKIVFLIMAALGIITAVSWDQVLKIVAEYFFGGVGDVLSKVIYAFFVTIITVVISIIVNKIFVKRKKKLFKKDITEILREIVKK